ncbi:hypothetical protein PRO82_000394 [Candidatus Protochlamydia amoebophila]|nr:hypothetical protein [Candidatus Protochlamydia amoebophila]
MLSGASGQKTSSMSIFLFNPSFSLNLFSNQFLWHN